MRFTYQIPENFRNQSFYDCMDRLKDKLTKQGVIYGEIYPSAGYDIMLNNVTHSIDRIEMNEHQVSIEINPLMNRIRVDDINKIMPRMIGVDANVREIFTFDVIMK